MLQANLVTPTVSQTKFVTLLTGRGECDPRRINSDAGRHPHSGFQSIPRGRRGKPHAGRIGRSWNGLERVLGALGLVLGALGAVLEAS